MTFHATIEAVQLIGAKPVLVDIDQTGQMATSSLERVINKYPIKALIPVHLYGIPAPIQKIEELIKGKEIAIIEDAAQAAGGRYNHSDEKIGGRNISCFSFYPTKNLSAYGDAGAICIGKNIEPSFQEKLLLRINSIKNHGRTLQGIQFLGRNSRCDHFQAAVLVEKLKLLPQQQEGRQRTAQSYYKTKLKEIKNLTLLDERFVEKSSWHLFPVLVENKTIRDGLRDYLRGKGIDSALFYNHRVNDLAPFVNVPGESEFAHEFTQRVICLPISPFHHDEEIKYIADSIFDFYSEFC